MFKKHFIPNKHNDYKPHILRRRAIFLILEFVLFVEIIFLVQMLLIIPYTDFFASILPNVLVDLTNSDRQSNNVSVLEINPILEKAAKLKAEDMAQKSYFSHTGPDGKTPWDWLDEVGYSFTSAGENLAVNFVDSKDIEKAWMNSPSHRLNILNNRFTEIGIGTARGIYQGRETVFVVQYFGKPVQAKVEETTSIEPSKPKPVAVETPKEQEETFIVLEQEIASPSIQGSAAPQDSEKMPLVKSSLLAKIVAMPKEVINVVYIFIAFVIIIALLLKIFIKPKVQYPKLIFNGILVLFVIISIFYLNSLIVQQGIVF